MRMGAAALLLAATLSGAAAEAAETQTVTTVPVKSFQGAGLGQPTGGLVFEGGLIVESATDRFGGLSGIGFTDSDGHLIMVSDRGSFVTGQLIYDQAGHPLTLVGVAIAAIQNSKGNDLPRAYARDAEALAIIERNGAVAAIRVGFENLTRVADFTLKNGIPDGAAKEVTIPDWLSRTRTNETLEAVCIAPATSPIAGSTLLLTEGVLADDGQHAAYLLGHLDKGALSYVSGRGTNPTDCAFLPNGDLLVLERGLSLLAFTLRLVRVPAAMVRPGAQLSGEVLLETTGGDIDNMEGLAVHLLANGETRITLVSDNNFNDWQRNLLLEFSFP